MKRLIFITLLLHFSVLAFGQPMNVEKSTIFGAITLENAATTQNFASLGGTWTKVNMGTVVRNDNVESLSVGTGNNSVIINRGGIYQVTFSFSLTTTDNNSQRKSNAWSFFVNESQNSSFPVALTYVRDFTNINQDGGNITYELELNAGDELHPYFRLEGDDLGNLFPNGNQMKFTVKRTR